VLVGQITLFVHAGSARHELDWLTDAGWEADAYLDETEISDPDMALLLAHMWPTLSTERLIEIAKDGRADARRQLEQILERRKEPVH
jgi:hypothetical protein